MAAGERRDGKKTNVAVTKARAPLNEDFERMLGELAAVGRKMSLVKTDAAITTDGLLKPPDALRP